MATARISDRLRELKEPTGQEEYLDVDFPRPRLRIPPWQACVVAVLVVAGVVAWLGISSRQSTQLAPVAPATPAETAGEVVNKGRGVASSESTPQAPSSVVVSVVGEVESAGLVTLAPGARLADALARARPLAHADLLGLNQAQLLVDGQQIVVLEQGSTVQSASAAGAGDSQGGGLAEAGSGPGAGKVSLNSASQKELESLSGVGEVTAAAIIAHREEIGGFNSVEQLLDVSGIGPAKFEKLKNDVTP